MFKNFRLWTENSPSCTAGKSLYQSISTLFLVGICVLDEVISAKTTIILNQAADRTATRAEKYQFWDPSSCDCASELDFDLDFEAVTCLDEFDALMANVILDGRGTPTAECPACGSEWFRAAIMLNPETGEIGMWGTEGACYRCNTSITIITPADFDGYTGEDGYIEYGPDDEVTET